MTEPTRRGRVQFLLLALVFFGPLAVAAWLYLGAGDWRPGATTNNGSLVDPVITLATGPMDSGRGGSTPAELLRDQWSIVYLERGDCAAECRDALLRIRQLRLATGREIDRVQRVLLVDGALPAADWLATEQPGLVTARPSSHAEIAAQLAPLGNGIYLVDPLGNLILAYPPESEPKTVYEDLKRLLRNSRIG